jgi:TonB family protein
MKPPKERKQGPRPSIDPEPSRTGGLLRTGAFSLILHAALVALVFLDLGPTANKGDSSIYRVIVKPVPGPEKGIKAAPVERVKKPQKEAENVMPPPSIPNIEVHRPDPAPVKQNPDREAPAPARPAAVEVPVKEQKPPPPHEDEKPTKPIPILTPVAEAPPDLSLEVRNREERPPVQVLPLLPTGLMESASLKREPEPKPETRRGSEGKENSGTGDGSGRPGGRAGDDAGQGPRTGRGSGAGYGSGEEGGAGGTGSGTRVSFLGLTGFGTRSGHGEPGNGSATGQGHSGSSVEGNGGGPEGRGRAPGNGSGPGGEAGSAVASKGTIGAGGESAVARPRYAENSQPVYPAEARKKGYQGVVMLRVEVLPNGLVGAIEVKKSSGHEVLDQSAVAAVKKWKFVPGKKEDVVVSTWVNVPVKFQIM